MPNPYRKSSLSPKKSKIIGIIFSVMSVFLFICFTAYVKNLLPLYAQKISSEKLIIYEKNNWFSILGGRFFFHKFGIFSYVFCWLFFVIGINKLFRKKVFMLRKQWLYSLIIILYGNILMGFLTPKYIFPYRGNLGDSIARTLMHRIGFWGTFITVLFVLPTLGYYILKKYKK